MDDYEDWGSNELYHHGILGMKWGVRRYQNKDGTRTAAGKKRERTLFVSGSSKTQFKDSGYYRKKLPKPVRKELKSYMRRRDKIIVGDAPGIDRQTQDYLKKKRYSNVEIYGPGKEVRYAADKKWKVNMYDSKYPEGSPQWLAKKDKAMTKAATEGLAVTLDEGSKATRNNVDRLINQMKDVKVYELSKHGKEYDSWNRMASKILDKIGNRKFNKEGYLESYNRMRSKVMDIDNFYDEKPRQRTYEDGKKFIKDKNIQLTDKEYKRLLNFGLFDHTTTNGALTLESVENQRRTGDPHQRANSYWKRKNKK